MKNPNIVAVVQIVSEALGAWKWANKRGRVRVAVVDTTKHHRQINHKGYLETLYESGSQCLDYLGGRWGYGAALEHAEQVAAKYNADKKS